MLDDKTHQENADTLTQYRLKMIEETLQKIADSLERLATLEAKHLETRDAVGRAFERIDSTDARLHRIELEMPTLKLVRSWVIAGIVGVVGLIGAAIVKLSMSGK